MKKNLLPKRGLILELALKDMFHDKLITINLILGTAAIIAPLLILFGLKFGIIETMSNRLINDPKNLEIRPISTQSYQLSWFKSLEKNDKIDFIIPMTRKLSSSVKIQPLSSSLSVTADIFATKANDPLLLKNQAIIPKAGFCVINHTLAQKTHLKEGDSLKCIVSRYINHKIQKVSVILKVSSILSPRAGFIKSLYVPLEVVENIEKYKDGLAVPKWGWKGNISEAYSVYDGVFIVVPKALSTLEQIRLRTGTGFAYIASMTQEEAYQKAKYHFDKKHFIYFIRPFKNAINNEHIGSLKIKLRGKNAKFFPWLKPIMAQIKQSKKAITLFAIPQKLKDKNLLVKPSNITIISDKKTLTLPLEIMPTDNNSSYYFVEAKILGKLALLRQRNLIYDEESKKILLARKGYASFRLYAKNLEDVKTLETFFEEKNINVSTQAKRIHEVQELDKYLTLIFWLIAIVGVIGGGATLSASLYSSVQRKRKELSILRLIGLSGKMIFRFPIYQGIIIAMSGVSVALLFFAIMATIINTLFQTHLQQGETFCTLTITHIFMVFGFSVFLAIFSSMLAAYQATKMDPAEAMRSE